jgi:membrane protease YdiL (CAAX protease family)
MVGVVVTYSAVRLLFLPGIITLTWDLYLDEIILFFIPLVLVLLFYRLDIQGSLQLRSIDLGSLPGFALAGFVVVLFQIFLLAIASRFVPDIARYLDINSYFGHDVFAEAVVSLPLVGQFWVVCIVPALIEELVFRGYVQTTLVGRLGIQRGIWATGFLFALVHLGMLRVPFDLLVSYIMGYFVIRYRSVWPAVVFHFTNNLVNLVILNVLPSDGLQHFSSLSLALMAGTVVYLGWQIVRFLQRASAELRAEAAVVI